MSVALRKESVDRNIGRTRHAIRTLHVALRKESVDRNKPAFALADSGYCVALRKESVDRNIVLLVPVLVPSVALRKESVDRNPYIPLAKVRHCGRSPQGERG